MADELLTPVEAVVTSSESEKVRDRVIEFRPRGTPAQVVEMVDGFLASMARYFPTALPSVSASETPDIESIVPTATLPGDSEAAGDA